MSSIIDLQTRREQLGYLADECMTRGLLIEPKEDGTFSLWRMSGKGSSVGLHYTIGVELVAGPSTVQTLLLELQAEAKPTFEWRAVAELSTVQGAGFESEWEPWEGPETDPEEIRQQVSDMGTSLGYEAASDAAGFSYGIQVRKIGEES